MSQVSLYFPLIFISDLGIERSHKKRSETPTIQRTDVYKDAFCFRNSGKTPAGSTTGLSCFLKPRPFVLLGVMAAKH
jgi:hypothetical protein